MRPDCVTPKAELIGESEDKKKQAPAAAKDTISFQ
jgi:hypothetical protein